MKVTFCEMQSTVLTVNPNLRLIVNIPYLLISLLRSCSRELLPVVLHHTVNFLELISSEDLVLLALLVGHINSH